MTAYPITATRRTTCEINAEHHGDLVPDRLGPADTATARWSCCGDVVTLGEIFDCDTCLEPGIAPEGATMPPGWIEDTHGHHCPRCQP